MPRNAKEKKLELNTLIKGEEREFSTVAISKVDKSASRKKTVSDKSDTKVAKTTTTRRKAPTTKTTKNSQTTKTTKSSAKTKTTSSKKSSTTKSSAKSSKTSSANAPSIVEYYDLPFRYNQTIVRILAQTPNILFIYWDISDKDRNAYIQKYGPDFFQNTRPYLIITNETMHYTFEVEINDFANSWYLHINDADCEYKVELGRKFIVDADTYSDSNTVQNASNNFMPYSINDYLPIVSSNEMEMPNNHILFDELGKSVFFRNVKTDIVQEKDISSISFLQKIGNMYHIYDLYKEIYKDELISDEFELNLPSS